MDESAINQVHPDSSPDEAEAFFGDDPADPTMGEFETEPDDLNGGLPSLTPEQQLEEARAYEEHHALKAEDPDPEPEPTEPQASGPVKQSGNLEREYIVFQSVQLTDKVLRRMLQQIEDGSIPEPRVAFFELHRTVSRNDKAAIGETYGLHRKILGEKCDLAAVSSRSFKKRHVAPKPPSPTASVAIT